MCAPPPVSASLVSKLAKIVSCDVGEEKGARSVAFRDRARMGLGTFDHSRLKVGK